MLLFLQQNLLLQNPSLKHLMFNWIKPAAERTVAWDFLQLLLTHLNPREIHPFPRSAVYFTCIISLALRLKRSHFQTHHPRFSVTSGREQNFILGIHHISRYNWSIHPHRMGYIFFISEVLSVNVRKLMLFNSPTSF